MADDKVPKSVESPSVEIVIKFMTSRPCAVLGVYAPANIPLVDELNPDPSTFLRLLLKSPTGCYPY